MLDVQAEDRAHRIGQTRAVRRTSYSPPAAHAAPGPDRWPLTTDHTTEPDH